MAAVEIGVQILIFGLLAGSVYSLLGLGLTLIMGVGKILNVGHGDLGVLGAYLAFWIFVGVKVDPLLALVIVLPALVMIGMAVQKYLINPAIKDPDTRITASVMITYGLALFISNAETIVFTPSYRFVNLSYAFTGFDLLGTTVNIPRLLVFLVSTAAAAGLILLLRTKFGKAIQASAQNQLLAGLVGVDSNRVAVATFGLSTSLAALAGVLYLLNNPLYPASGLGLTIKGLTVMVLGGIGNVAGALLAGLLLGLAESMTSFFLGDIYRELVVYLLLVAVLLIRPSGLFGSLQV